MVAAESSGPRCDHVPRWKVFHAGGPAFAVKESTLSGFLHRSHDAGFSWVTSAAMPWRSHLGQSTGSRDRQAGELRSTPWSWSLVYSNHPGSRLRPVQRRAVEERVHREVASRLHAHREGGDVRRGFVGQDMRDPGSILNYEVWNESPESFMNTTPGCDQSSESTIIFSNSAR